MVMTKIMRIAKNLEDETIRGEFFMTISSIVEYSISRTKLNLSYLVVGFMDEQLLLSLIKGEEEKLLKSLDIVNEIATEVIGENIYSGKDPQKFAMQLACEFCEKPIPYERIKE